MTWEDLQKLIDELPAKSKKTDVTIRLMPDDEFFRVENWGITGNEADVLDEGHPYLEIGEPKL